MRRTTFLKLLHPELRVCCFCLYETTVVDRVFWSLCSSHIIKLEKEFVSLQCMRK